MILDFKLKSKKTEKIETSIWFMQNEMYCFSFLALYGQLSDTGVIVNAYVSGESSFFPLIFYFVPGRKRLC